ncbi:MAG: hypothetical protein ABSB35_38300 [Bryobacteraceae bacterium]|jgi:uncharacterized protein (TIGR03437 family)
MTKIAQTGLLLLMAWQVNAQTFDNSGNGLLSGTFYFRQVLYTLTDTSGDLSDAQSAYGTITFSGTGSYSISGTVVDLAAGQLETLSQSGTYTISASGLGFISNPLASGSQNQIYGLVSQGVFIGSSTANQSGFNDLFIAAPANSSLTNAAFSGSYNVDYMNFQNFEPVEAYDIAMQLSPNGSGSLGTVSWTGYTLGASGPTTFTQSVGGVKYAATNGANVVTFPNSNTNAFSGQYYLYPSPDGNFIFGGSPQDVDMFIGVRASSGTPSFSGLYYQAGLDEDETNLNLTAESGYVIPDSYFGSFDAFGGNQVLGHQRLLFPSETSTPDDYTFNGAYSFNSDGSIDDGGSINNSPDYHYQFTSNGVYRIGFGEGPVYGLNVAIQAPPPSTFSGSGIYLNPTGVENAGSSALFTAGISPGELIELYGTGLASTTTSNPLFPTTLGGVQVLINFRASPILSVSPTRIVALVPYELNGATNVPADIADIQILSSSGTRSNTISVLTSTTSPGVLTQSANGLGLAAAQHSANYATITSANPAQIGETITLYLTGLGLVSPLINDGAVGPTPASITVQPFDVYIGGQQATVVFSGLTPGAISLYQMNVVVPSGVSAGNNAIEVIGPDSDTYEAVVPVGGGAAVAAPEAVTKRHSKGPSNLFSAPAPLRREARPALSSN